MNEKKVSDTFCEELALRAPGTKGVRHFFPLDPNHSFGSTCEGAAMNGDPGSAKRPTSLAEERGRGDVPNGRRRLLVAALGTPMIVATSAQTAMANNGGTNTSAGTGT